MFRRTRRQLIHLLWRRENNDLKLIDCPSKVLRFKYQAANVFCRSKTVKRNIWFLNVQLRQRKRLDGRKYSVCHGRFGFGSVWLSWRLRVWRSLSLNLPSPLCVFGPFCLPPSVRPLKASGKRPSVRKCFLHTAPSIGCFPQKQQQIDMMLRPDWILESYSFFRASNYLASRSEVAGDWLSQNLVCVWVKMSIMPNIEEARCHCGTKGNELGPVPRMWRKGRNEFEMKVFAVMTMHFCCWSDCF